VATAAESFAGGRYVVDRVLGRGGMATVYLARDRELGREVAIKTLELAQDDELAARFRREATTAAGLAHPNIVQVFDVGDDDGRPFIVMEHVDGESLDALLARRGRVDAATALSYAEQACAALAHAHAAGVVHRDVKPANLFVRADGTLKVGDFGIARAADTTTLTQVGTLLGTADYVAPEQARGEPVGPAADLFSLGVVLYELVAGQPPWRLESLAQIGEARPRPRPLQDVAPDVSPSYAKAVMRCLRPNPSDRPATAAALAGELSDGPGTAATVALGDDETRVIGLLDSEPRRPVRRRWPFDPRLLAAALVTLLVLVATVMAIGGGDGSGDPADAPAPVEPVPARGDAAEQSRNLAEWLREHTAEG
jgi:eukaryotic-like serine/threonine-protein kinase